MNGSRDEGMLIPRKWCHDRDNLLLAFQASTNTEVVRVGGRISSLNVDRLLFVYAACSASVPLESAMFEYEEGATDVLTQGKSSEVGAVLSGYGCLRLCEPGVHPLLYRHPSSASLKQSARARTR